MRERPTQARARTTGRSRPTAAATTTDGGGTTADGGGTTADGGGTTADGGGTTTDGGTSADASTADGGMSCSPGTLQLMDTCPAFTACGGDVVGSWCYTDICITHAELIGTLGSLCPALTFTSSSGTVTGSVEFTDTMVTRQVTVHGEGTAHVPMACLSGVACSNLATNLSSVLPPGLAISCADAAGGCDCDFTYDSSVDESDTYDAAGDVITTHPSSGDRTFDYCVETDGSMRFHETTTGGGEPGIQTISPAG